MKLTEAKLKKLIVEVLNEVRTLPEMPMFTRNQLDKLHTLIDSGDESYINMARSIIDGKGGDPNYVDQYIAYQEVGDIEKLGNQVADMYEPAEYLSRRPLKPGFSEEDTWTIDTQAYKLAAAKAAKPGYETARYDSPYGEITIRPYEAMMDRYYQTRNPRPEDMLKEVRTLPSPGNVTPEQLEKIHSLIDSGDESFMNMAQSLIDGAGGDPNYVDDYLEYQKVGDLEKLGTKAAGLTDNREYAAAMTDAFRIANQKTAEMHPDLADGNYQSLADLERGTATSNAHMDRYFSSKAAAERQQKRRQR